MSNILTDSPSESTELRELLSFLLLDGQNQIHDLKDGEATPEQVTERMYASLDYFTEKAESLITERLIEELETLEALPNVYPEKIDGEYTHVKAIYKSAIKDRISTLKDTLGEKE